MTLHPVDPLAPLTPKILIVDLVGLAIGPEGCPDHAIVKAHIELRGGVFHEGSARSLSDPEVGKPNFYYLPYLSTEDDLLAEAGDGLYDAVIAAATFLPKGTRFDQGGVRIGTGTGNMGSASWGGSDGRGGTAPLMNTPGVNARATAQMVMKALLHVRPDLPIEEMSRLVATGRFDTGRDLSRFPTMKLEGRTFAVIGYGNIGREVAKLASAFRMNVRIFARSRHRKWIESEGFCYASSPSSAAAGADVLSVHIGLGPLGPGGHANVGLISEDVLSVLAEGAVLINYDRGELVDVEALDAALASGRVAHAAIDADIFSHPVTGALSGPMVRYLSLLPEHASKLSLLPHVAADTDHTTRVAGAIQAVDQILDVFRQRVVRNLKGDLPRGYINGGTTRPLGLGGATRRQLDSLRSDKDRFERLHVAASRFLSALDALRQAEEGLDVAEQLLMESNNLASLLRSEGFEGPILD